MLKQKAEIVIQENKEIQEVSGKIAARCETNCESVIIIAYVTIIIVNLIKIYLTCKDRFPNLAPIIAKPNILHKFILRREINSVIKDEPIDKTALASYIMDECKQLSEQRLQEICSKYSI